MKIPRPKSQHSPEADTAAAKALVEDSGLASKFPATGNPQPRIGTVITAPPDGCPNCGERNIPPNYSWIGGPLYKTLYGRYSHCGIQWDTGWKIENLT